MCNSYMLFRPLVGMSVQVGTQPKEKPGLLPLHKIHYNTTCGAALLYWALFTSCAYLASQTLWESQEMWNGSNSCCFALSHMYLLCTQEQCWDWATHLQIQYLLTNTQLGRHTCCCTYKNVEGMWMLLHIMSNRACCSPPHFPPMPILHLAILLENAVRYECLISLSLSEEGSSSQNHWWISHNAPAFSLISAPLSHASHFKALLRRLLLVFHL